MFQFAENRALDAVLDTESFGELELLFFISLFLPLFLFVSLQGRQIENRQSNDTKERVASRASEPRKKTIPKLGPDTRPSRPPAQLTIAEALGFSAQPELGSEPGPTREITIDDALGQRSGLKRDVTIGDALGLIGRNKARTDKKSRKWKASLIGAVAKISGNRLGGRGSEGKPLISLMIEMDRAEKTGKRKKVPVGMEKKGENGVCRVCRERNEDAAFVPCGHAYCRVCSREIWINRRSCPVCKCRIVEVLDSI